MAARPQASSSQPAKKDKQKTNPTFLSAWRDPNIGQKNPPNADGGKKNKDKTNTQVADLPPAPPSGFTTAGSHYRVEYEPGLEMAASAVNKWAQTAYASAAGAARPGEGLAPPQPIPIKLVSSGQYDGQFVVTRNRGEIILRVPSNATISNSPTTNREALVNIGNPLNYYSAVLAHETTHALLYRANPNGTAWRQEGPGSSPLQAAENLGQYVTGPQ